MIFIQVDPSGARVANLMVTVPAETGTERKRTGRRRRVQQEVTFVRFIPRPFVREFPVHSRMGHWRKDSRLEAGSLVPEGVAQS